MSCCEGTSGGLERYPGTGCCGTSCAAGKTGCSASEPRIRSCFCQENVGCLDRPDCGGFRPRGTAATGACPGPCQCAEEEAWNRNVPPKPNCEWLSNFSELRRQWSDHGRQNNCKCCNCKPCRTAAPCRPCLPPPPTCSTANFARDDCQSCCNERLSGGASVEKPTRNPSPTIPDPPSSDQRDRLTAGGCQSPPYTRAISPSCSSPQNPATMYSPCSPAPCSPPSVCSFRSAAACRPPGSCQPCAPSPRASPKKRSCCQCITGGCMCQPMPRECKCPPPVQVDARAERECTCDCPSAPECACPPSERRFARTKVKCPNARLCRPSPRPQPGPKCDCTECQPCLPPPCDPCTAAECRTILPRVRRCCGASAAAAAAACDDSAACRACAPQDSAPCRPVPNCADCCKMAPPGGGGGGSTSGGWSSGSRPPAGRLARLLQNRSRSPNPGGSCCSTGQSCREDESRSCNDARGRTRSAAVGEFDDDDDDDDGEADPGCRGARCCHCGSSIGWLGGCDECEICCDKVDKDDGDDNNDWQCNCGDAVGCAEECDYCCAAGCNAAADASPDNGKLDLESSGGQQCGCGSDGNKCAESCDYCCSRDCDADASFAGGNKAYNERIAAGGMTWVDSVREDDGDNDNGDDKRESGRNFENRVELRDKKSVSRPLESTPEVPHLEELSRLEGDGPTIGKHDADDDDDDATNGNAKRVREVAAETERPSSACKILRYLIRGKFPAKY